METSVYTFKLNIDWQLISLISQIDRFDSSWTSIEKREGQSLKQLKSIATVRSVGASTRIEGSRMTDEEVEVLIKDIDISKIVKRHSLFYIQPDLLLSTCQICFLLSQFLINLFLNTHSFLCRPVLGHQLLLCIHYHNHI